MSEHANVIYPPDMWFNTAATSKLIYLMGLKNEYKEPLFAKLAEELPNFIVALPDSSIELDNDEKLFVQAEWETAHIRLASSIGGLLFWLTADTTDKQVFELAEWITHLKYRKMLDPDRKLTLVLGIESDILQQPLIKYLCYRLAQDLPGFVVYTKWEEASDELVKLIKQAYAMPEQSTHTEEVVQEEASDTLDKITQTLQLAMNEKYADEGSKETRNSNIAKALNDIQANINQWLAEAESDK